ncbi:hypothetical protein ACLOJK_037407, partial [Asimina triloba]
RGPPADPWVMAAAERYNRRPPIQHREPASIGDPPSSSNSASLSRPLRELPSPGHHYKISSVDSHKG